MKSGIELIVNERKRQIEEEGWSQEHDAQYTHNELIWAAMCYTQPESFRAYERVCNSKTPNNIKIPPAIWPWDEKWWKPTPDNRIKELVKAGALIAAEIDRIQSLDIENDSKL
ncbi:MAG: hypothetical protein IKO56_10665 [Alphaproteobacteria bacterium]|nr:hypothetical protein [Alphaproteobacteria bacterium]